MNVNSHHILWNSWSHETYENILNMAPNELTLEQQFWEIVVQCLKEKMILTDFMLSSDWKVDLHFEWIVADEDIGRVGFTIRELTKK